MLMEVIKQIRYGECPMKLFIEGRVVRSAGSLTAIRMDHHDFRTQGRSQIEADSTLAMAAG
jgi:hypothetical protein